MNRCHNCSDASLFPDGGLRCNYTNLLAVEPCIRHNYGNPKIYTIEELKKLNQAEMSKAIKQKVQKVKRPVVKSTRKTKSTLQGKLL